jgi:hypothetical protein
MAPSSPNQRAVAFVAAFSLAFAALNHGASRAAAALHAARERDLMLLRHVPGATPHYDWSCGEDLASALPAVPDARKAPLVLVSGMSQTYAINDANEGALPLPDRLDASLAKRGVRAFGLVAPNLQNEEALLMLVAALSRPETKPAAWLYGLCFDKLRNVDVRPAMLSFLATRPDVRERWDHLCDSEGAMFPLACERLKSTSKRAAEERPATTTVIGKIEENTRNAAADVMPLARDRTALNAAGQTKIYELRNWLLGIRTTTERPIIPARYQLNMDLLRLSVRIAKRNGVRPIFYVIPLNPEAKAPYQPEEYAAFKREALALAQAEQIAFANLENAVPEGEWGLLYGQPDFKHFREAGHARLTDALLRSFDGEWQQLAHGHGELGP